MYLLDRLHGVKCFEFNIDVRVCVHASVYNFVCEGEFVCMCVCVCVFVCSVKMLTCCRIASEGLGSRCVCVCVYFCVCVCLSVSVSLCVRACTHVRICICLRKREGARVCVYIHTLMVCVSVLWYWGVE